MFKIILLSFLSVYICSCATISNKNTDLIFLGTVISIENSPLDNSPLNWIITVNVDKVILGSFSDETFKFRIHSPAKSEIEEKKQYSIEATLTQDGYTVDQYQWRRVKQKLPENPSEEELKKIGLAMISALEEWTDGTGPRIINILKSSEFKPFAEHHYIANWFLDQDGHSLYCNIGRGEDLRFDLYVQLKKIGGEWIAMKPIVQKTWRARTK